MLEDGYPPSRVGSEGPARGRHDPGSSGVAASQADPEPGRRKLGWIALASLGVALALLTVAEITWLHDLPSQPSRRVAVVLLPSMAGTDAPADPVGGSQADSAAGPAPDGWAAKALDLARDPAVMKAAAAAAGDITPDWLASHIHVTGTCIQTAVSGKLAIRGLLVYAAVHGQAESRLPAIASAWAGAFSTTAEGSLGAVRATRQDALLVPIRACD